MFGLLANEDNFETDDPLFNLDDLIDEDTHHRDEEPLDNDIV